VEVRSSDGSGSGNFGLYFGDVKTKGEGSVAYYSFRKRGNPQALYQAYEDSIGDNTWAKLCILSNRLSSSVVNEAVLVTPYGSNQLGAYHQNGGGFPTEDVGLATPDNNNDFTQQGEFDRGANPLTGTNPDSGAAWSAGEQARGRYATLYSARSSPRAANYREGYGDPFSGGWREKPDQFNTYLMRVQIGTWGAANSRFTVWAAHEGLAPVLLIDSENITFGSWSDHDMLWLLHYVTNRVAGGRQVASRSNNITGATVHVCGPGTPIGAGTLEYNATTQRFRFSGAGESFGTARGFSNANGFLTFNVAGSGAKSYLVVEVAPASLPSAGTTTDTITIAADRPLGVCWYADPIASDVVIPFPGGFVPALPGATALAAQAASMSSGQWQTFSMPNLANSTFTAVSPGGGQASLFNTFGNRMLWDPVHKKMQYAACAHTGGAFVAGAGGLATWDDATNTWTRETYTWSSEDPGHSYYHIVCNPNNGDLYFRSFNSRTIYRRVYGTTGAASWVGFSTISNVGAWSNQVAGALDWWPALNGGAGGFGFANELGAAFSNSALTGWTWQSGTSPSGPYHNWGIVAGGLFYFGGGNGSSAMYSMSTSGAITNRPSTPLEAGSANASVVLPHPNGTDLLLFQNNAATGAIHRFNGTAWSAAGTHQIGANDGMWVGCTIPEYGVIVFVRNQGTGSGTPTCIVYKP
jgi:hypothetical protein